MNAERKKRLREAMDQLDTAQATLHDIAQEYRDEFDELSEKRQEGEKGEKLTELADQLEAAGDQAEHALEEVRNVLG